MRRRSCERGGLVTARGAESAQLFSAGCSDLEYEELLLAEAEVLASCGPELLDRMWVRVIEKELARAPVLKFEEERDLTATDLSVLVVEDNPFQQQAIGARAGAGAGARARARARLGLGVGSGLGLGARARVSASASASARARLLRGYPPPAAGDRRTWQRGASLALGARGARAVAPWSKAERFLQS